VAQTLSQVGVAIGIANHGRRLYWGGFANRAASAASGRTPSVGLVTGYHKKHAKPNPRGGGWGVGVGGGGGGRGGRTGSNKQGDCGGGGAGGVGWGGG